MLEVVDVKVEIDCEWVEFGSRFDVEVVVKCEVLMG